MRLLFLSDTQLGGGAIYGTPQHPRLADAEETLAKVSALCAHRGIDELVFAGDAFQHRRPAIDELLVFGRFLESLPCPYALVAGNHDARGPGLPSTLDLFGQRDGNVFVTPGTRHLDAGARVAFLPWSHPGPLRAQREGATALEQAEALLKIAEGLHEEVANFTTRVLVTHHALTGMSLPTGLSTGELAGEVVLDTAALAEQGWSYVFAGHIHKADAIVSFAETATVVSIGSPWVQDFGEADGKHGVWILDTDRDELEHVELAGRRFVTLDLSDAELGPLPWFDAAGVEGAVVRVRITCTEQAARELDLERIRRELLDAGALKVHAITLDVQRTTRARADGMAEDAQPLEALDRWLHAVDSTPEEAERLRTLTRQLLEQEVKP